MTSWDMTIDLPPPDVISLLRGMPEVAVFDIETGLGIEFGDGRAAWVDVDRPADESDRETDIVVKDFETAGAWQIYDFLAALTSVPLRMWDDGGSLVIDRHWAHDGTAAPGRAEPRLRTWDSRAVALQLAELVRSRGAISPALVCETLAGSGVAQEDVSDRSSELVGEMIRAGILRLGAHRVPPVDRGRFNTALQEIVFEAYALFRTHDGSTTPCHAAFTTGPTLEAVGDRPLTVADLRTWMRPGFFWTDDA